MQENHDEILKKISNLQMWRNGDQRAPHKPLLILFALAKIKNNQRLISFVEIEEPLKKLLKNFGPRRNKYQPDYPFYRLKNDGIWEVFSEEPLSISTGGDASPKELREKKASAGFLPSIFETLENDKELIEKIARQLLYHNFPESLHEQILKEIGLSLSEFYPQTAQNNFRDDVLRAYGRKCAICNFDVKLANEIFGLEATYIKWQQANGPELIENSLCLCIIHHKAFNYGAIGINQKFNLVVSTELHGSNGFNEWFLTLKGRKINLPTKFEWNPKPDFINWHLKEVFKHPAQD